MKITFLTSASVLIEDQGVKILCDPWLVDGEFYGSWYHYPPCDFKPEDFNDVDYIYISHIHPDHFSTKTLSRMNKKIPVLIHDFHHRYLHDSIVRLGFVVITLKHNERTLLKNNLFINILAADNCNPEICMKYFGCGLAEKTLGSTSIDSMCVIDNGKKVIVNTNDCPFQVGHESASRIKENYKEIDFLLAGYSSATAYPQCFELSESVLEDAKKTIKEKFLRQTESYVNLFKPKYFMPFAGRYVLSGKNHFLNEKRSIPELEEAYDYFEKSKNIEHDKSKCIILNQKSNFDLSNNTQSENYTHIIKSQKLDYIEKHLSKQKYDYEQNEFPSINDLLKLLEKSFSRFDSKCKELCFSSDTTILISLPGENILKIPCNGESFELIPRETLKDISKYVYISLDSRLLKLLLSGPKYAHWNNAEIGSHLKFKRNPNVYERALFYCLNYLHA